MIKNELSIVCVILSIIYFIFFTPFFPSFNEDDCPYCFGKNFCSTLKNDVNIKHLSFFEIICNYLSVKNVFYVYLGNKKIVLKRLAHNSELEALNNVIFEKKRQSNKPQDLTYYKQEIIHFITTPDDNKVKNFRVCSTEGGNLFLEALTQFNSDLEEHERLISIWTIVRVNAEPLILHILNKNKDSWPVPKYFGACGRVVGESYNGVTLNNVAHFEWSKRIYLSLQLLELAIKFTQGDDNFRYYLTDISPDNLAIDSLLNLTFIDLENVIMVPKKNKSSNIHHISGSFDVENVLSYSEIELCESSLSDHNIYYVCKLILSKNAPYPMMKGGLLYGTPSNKISEYDAISRKLELCATSTSDINRFDLAKTIIRGLKKLTQ